VPAGRVVMAHVRTRVVLGAGAGKVARLGGQLCAIQGQITPAARPGSSTSLLSMTKHGSLTGILIGQALKQATGNTRWRGGPPREFGRASWR